MDVRRLRYFVAVAEECHFGRAADRLFIAQPALSQQIKALESELGVTLFTRSTRRVELTPAGARLQVRAVEVLRLFDAAIEETRRVDAGEDGLLRLGFIGSATYSLMPALSRALQAEVPLLQVELKGELLGPEVEAALIQGRIDLGVLRPFEPADGIEVCTLRTEPLVAALPADHPAAHAAAIDLAALAVEQFVNYPRHHSVIAEAVRSACATAGFEPQVRREVRETATLVSFVAAGLGVALVPAGVRSVRIPGVVYVPLQGEAPTVDLVAAWRRDGPAGALTRALRLVRDLA